MKTEIVSVNPEMAKAWLKSTNTLNRKIRPDLVSQYASDMASGLWRTTHQGIAFCEDGTLSDGQHRLSAVVKSGQTVQMMVTHGLPKDCGSSVDLHARRMLHDALRIGGSEAWVATADCVAIARFMMSGMGVSKHDHSAAEVEAYALRYQKAIKFVLSITISKRKHLTASGLSACYACALIAGESEASIARFARVIFTGEHDGPEESAAIKLRDYLIFTGGVWAGHSRVQTAKRAQRAIQAFCARQPLHRLTSPEALIYPAPTI